MADNTQTPSSANSTGDQQVTMSLTQLQAMMRDTAVAAVTQALTQQSSTARREREDQASSVPPPHRAQPPPPPAGVASDNDTAAPRITHEEFIAVATTTSEYLDNPGNIQGAAEAIGNRHASTAAIPVLVAATRDVITRNDPTHHRSIPVHDMLDSTLWGQHLRVNNRASDAIIHGIERFFRSTLATSFNTQHMMMLSLESLIKAAARNPDLCEDEDFCEGANLLIRELVVDHMAKSGTDAPGLLAARDRARSAKLPDALKEMHTAAIERNKLQKKGN
jgi:hypothetical protein